MTTIALEEKCRQQMNQRLARIERRMVTVSRLTTDLSQYSPDEKGMNALTLEDDFAHIVAELQAIQYDYCGYTNESGHEGEGKGRINKWKLTLSSKDQRTWEIGRQVRNIDVHEEPLSTVTKEVTPMLLLRGKAPMFFKKAERYHVKVVLEDGTARTIGIRIFCNNVVRLLRKFIDEFDRI